MKVILQKEVDKLGTPGQVVEVADGYARNYLIPKGMAMAATKGAVRHAERLRRAHEEYVRKDLTEAQAVADRLGAEPLRMEARAGDDGRLFGSITVADIASELEKATGVPVDRKQVRLAEAIRNVGTHEVVVHVHQDVNATVTLEVVAAA
ncbi:MAG TPA: 50S ribosomal protein L9 [Actinomycetota bacterium]|jgi:large subunit ribosomal protein L9